MTEEVKKLLEKADHALHVAEVLIKDGYPSDAAGKRRDSSICSDILRTSIWTGYLIGL